MTNNPLESLLTDINEDSQHNLEILRDILMDYCRIDKNSFKIDFLPNFYSLNNENKLLVVLAASKARSKLFKLDENISPSEIISMDIMPEGSVKSTLKRLLDIGEIKSGGGVYFLPNYRLADLSNRFKSLFDF